MKNKLSFVLLGVAVSLQILAIVRSEETTSVQTPLALHLYPQNQQVKEGETATWYLTAAGAEPLRYQWKLNGKNVLGGNKNTLKIVSAKLTDQGLYVCSIKNESGVVETEPVQLAVIPAKAFSTAQKINKNQPPTNTSVKNSSSR